MELNRDQVVTLAKYFADLSKILVATTVIGFFVPSGVGPIDIPTFTFGSLTAAACLILSVRLLQS